MGLEQRIIVWLEMMGGAKYKAAMVENAAATKEFQIATAKASKEQQIMTRRTFLQNQVLFTMRRLLFYTTLGLIAFGAVALRWGFQYNSAIQTARVALAPMITDQRTLNTELGKLYTIAATSPFLFKDMTTAFRSMYPAFKSLGYSLDFTNKTIQAIVDGMSLAGRTAPSQLNRVSIALQHMAFMGRPMQRQIQQLAMDGLPIYAALTTQLGLTDAQFRNIARSGITAKQVLEALQRYIAITPGYSGAAVRQASKTLLGGWQMFRDITSQAMGQSEHGLFQGLTRMFSRVNVALSAKLRANKPVSLQDVFGAFDKAVTPQTHFIINMFTMLRAALASIVMLFGALIWSFSMLAKVINGVLWPLEKIGLLGKSDNLVMKILGGILGILITAFLLERVAVIGSALAHEYHALSLWYDKVMIEGWAVTAWIATGATYAWTAAMWALNAAIWANPLTWLVVAVLALTVGLVILYFKWKAFRDLVNETATWIWKNWYWAGLLISIMVPFLGLAVYLAGILAKNWERVSNAIQKAYYYLIKMPSNKINDYSNHPTKLFHSLVNLMGGKASGGSVGMGGSYLVGELGPEIVNLPGGSHVIPNKEIMGGLGNLLIKVYPQAINLDGKQIGQVLATVVTDIEARQ